MPPNTVNAYCHLRGEDRSFVLSRIEEVIEAETGEVIPDIWVYLGLASLKPPAPQMPVFRGTPVRLTAEEAQNLRRADKKALFARYKHDCIAQAMKRRLWGLFGDRCFRCERRVALELDHHVPQHLGGRLVPGNVVLLCGVCNLAKKKMHPSAFYSELQLDALQPILEAELKFFDFRFDWTRWTHHPEEYLLSLGVEPALAKQAAESSCRLP